MNIKEIQKLIKFVSKSKAKEVSLELKDFKITIKTGDDGNKDRQIPVIPSQNQPVIINKDDLAKDITEAVRLAREAETSSAETQRQIRTDVYDMEREMQKRFREMDQDIRDNKDDLEEKISTILENPLNDVE